MHSVACISGHRRHRNHPWPHQISNTPRLSGGVHDDREPRYRLCACQEHQPRFPTGCDHSTPATASPGTGQAWRGPQPESPGAVPCPRRSSEAVSRTLPASVAPAARGHRRPAARAVPGAHSPRVGAIVPVPVNPVIPGHPARLWPPSPRLAGHGDIRRVCRRLRRALQPRPEAHAPRRHHLHAARQGVARALTFWAPFPNIQRTCRSGRSRP